MPEKRESVIAELRRELDVRSKVFPAWIQKGKLKRDTAKRRCALMEIAMVVLEAMTDEEFKEILARDLKENRPMYEQQQILFP